MEWTPMQQAAADFFKKYKIPKGQYKGFSIPVTQPEYYEYLVAFALSDKVEQYYRDKFNNMSRADISDYPFDLKKEILDRYTYLFKQTDGTMKYPSSAEGDLLKMIFDYLNGPTTREEYEAYDTAEALKRLRNTI